MHSTLVIFLAHFECRRCSVSGIDISVTYLNTLWQDILRSDGDSGRVRIAENLLRLAVAFEAQPIL